MADVSIIVPVYNSEKTIERCLNSLINQTYPNFEVICVDDGSQDKSLDILKEYEKKCDKIQAYSQEHIGVAFARNFAISKITGKYLMFLDSDDWYEPEMISEMVKTIEKENTDVVVCDYYEEDFSGKEITQKENLLITGKSDINFFNMHNIDKMLWNKIFKVELLNKYNLKYPTKFEHDDTMFIYKYFAIAKTHYGLNKKLYHYVTGNKDSIMGKLFSGTNFGCEYDFIYAFDDLFTFISNLQNREYECYIKMQFIYTFSKFIKYLSPEFQENARKKVKEYVNNSPYFKTNNPADLDYIEYM